MNSTIKVAVAGAGGRMGRETVHSITAQSDIQLVAQIYRGDDLAAIIAQSHPSILVDFTVPEAVMPNLRIAIAAHVIPLVGTTGLTPENIDELESLCKTHQTACLIAPNFAIGAVLLMRFAEEAAAYLPDAEIIEMHHERKLDAPSGTARRTAELIDRGRQASPMQQTPIAEPENAFEIVAGARGGLSDDGIRIHSVRLPGFIASQEVIFGAPGQRLSIRHDSIDRSSFMPGVLWAIRRSAHLHGLVIGLERIL